RAAFWWGGGRRGTSGWRGGGGGGGGGEGRVILSGGNEIRDHDHVATGTAERAVGLVPQVGGHGGHPVRLLDRELGDREVGGVLANQCDVGPVEGGDDLEVALGLQHLLGKPR